MAVQTVRNARIRSQRVRDSLQVGRFEQRVVLGRDYWIAHADGVRVDGIGGRVGWGWRDCSRPLRVAAAALPMMLVLGVGVAGAVPTRATASRMPGIVDVNTKLGYVGAAAAGTGIVVSSSGEVLTNNHVIEGSTTVSVTDIDNNHTYAATVVGYDISADIAVLQLKNASGLKTAPLGNSAKAKVDQSITALGNAGGVGGTPSQATGKITGLNQSLTALDDMNGGAEQLTGMIETNAALEPGDSGGPLINSNQRVLGIDTAGGANGFSFAQQATQGFAIPINRATALASQIESGHATENVHIGPTPFLGIGVEEVDISQEFQTVPGLLVTGVISGLPAAKAGLAAYDFVTSLDGHATTTGTALTDLLLTKKPGDTVKLGWVDQNGIAHTSTIRLASGPPQ
jgi:S1-C subfamily serine protease